MAQHKLDLKENAIDSFNEALTKYRSGLAGSAKAFKFSILHLSHSLELLFKYYVSQAHPLLIYRNPFSKNIAKEPTIGLWDAIQFLQNEGASLDKDFLSDLAWLKRLRNDIEHYAFDMDLPTARRTMGRMVQAINDFHQEISSEDIEDFVSRENFELFSELINENQRDLGNARIEAKELTEDQRAHSCRSCGYEDTAAMISNVITCQYCGEMDEVIYCCICGDRTRTSDSILWNDDHESRPDYACDACAERIHHMD
ncbi:MULTISPECIES: hypothetical protein [Lysobacter]|uniref:hypothetical protein n=1 Tax=Lysobacter TaxID=68 RepID=UPI001F18967C|nr:MULTISPECIES: hypothetical protein [Lysobacter]UJB17637.1 hypothetical protein L1A79_14805 [Lysobacter capsici]UJQ28641.1 hypothetical protein L2D09_00065 [Lysobacter gummosus]